MAKLIWLEGELREPCDVCEALTDIDEAISRIVDTYLNRDYQIITI